MAKSTTATASHGDKDPVVTNSEDGCKEGIDHDGADYRITPTESTTVVVVSPSVTEVKAPSHLDKVAVTGGRE